MSQSTHETQLRLANQGNSVNHALSVNQNGNKI